MIALKTIVLRRSINLSKKLNTSLARCSSTATKLYEPADKETQRIENLKPLKKAPSKAPFVKNFFVGQFDSELLAYPEFLGEKRLRLLEANTQILKTMVAENIDPLEIDKICNIPEKVLQILRDMKLFGVIAPAKYGGLELTHTERARVYEVLAKDTSVAAMLFSHETLGHKVITQYGTEDQKEKYLRKLVSGKSIAAYCANEQESGADIANMSTYALKTGDDMYLLNGTKTWVMNADSADVFIVFAKIKTSKQIAHPANKYYRSTIEEEEHVDDYVVDDVGVFLIDKSAPGITISERKDTLGVRGLHMCDVSFKDTPVPVQNVLGNDEKQGYEVAKKFLVEDRYIIGVLALNILRKMEDDMTQYSIRRKLYSDNLCNYGLTQIKIARATCNLYTIESMVYYTCGLMDMYENQDCEVENAIVKVFASEVAWQTINDGMQLLGGQAYLRNQPYEKYFRDLKVLSIFDVSNEVLKMFIALCGLKYISNDLFEDVVQGRNPYFHPKAMLSKFFSTMRVATKDPKLYLKLYEDVHPTLCTSSDLLEKSLLRFEHAVQQSFYRYGVGLVDDQFALNRIADAVIYIYAMTAIISRASRSYSIGTKNADDELVVVEALVREYSFKFDDICEGLVEGETYVTDTFHKKIAKRTIKSKGYQLVDPLKLNY